MKKIAVVSMGIMLTVALSLPSISSAAATSTTKLKKICLEDANEKLWVIITPTSGSSRIKYPNGKSDRRVLVHATTNVPEGGNELYWGEGFGRSVKRKGQSIRENKIFFRAQYYRDGWSGFDYPCLYSVETEILDNHESYRVRAQCENIPDDDIYMYEVKCRDITGKTY